MTESRWKKNAAGARKTLGPGILIGAVPDGVEIADITPDSFRLLLPEPARPVRYLDEVVSVEESPEDV